MGFALRVGTSHFLKALPEKRVRVRLLRGKNVHKAVWRRQLRDLRVHPRGARKRLVVICYFVWIWLLGRAAVKGCGVVFP